MSKSDIIRPDVSVIIPVYNVESYIKECAESLFNQTLKNIEFIFIDDCSNDNSLSILNKLLKAFPERRHQTKIITHNENKGVAYSRQEGIELSTGKWLIHCDPDDIIEKNAYEIMLHEALKTNSDIIICNYRLFGDNISGSIKYQGEGEIKGLNLVEALCGSIRKNIHGSLCNKLLKRELWNNTRLIENLAYCEDKLALLDILIKNPDIKINIIPNIFYNYRVHSGSLTFRRDENRKKDLLRLIEIIEKMKLSVSKEYLDSLDSQVTVFLYLYLQCKPNLKEFSKRFGNYLQLITKNKSLNYFQLLHLREGLKGHVASAVILGYCNKYGISLIKGINRGNYFNKIKKRNK